MGEIPATLQAIIDAHEKRLTVLETRFEDMMKVVQDSVREIKDSLQALSTGNTPLCAQHKEQIRTLEREMGELRSAREADQKAALEKEQKDSEALAEKLDKKLNWKTFVLVHGIMMALNAALAGWLVAHLMK